MKRIQLFEFEDQPWFPHWIRTAITRLIVVLNKLMGVNEVLSELLHTVLGRIKANTIVDLGSGSGGSMPEVLQLLQEKQGNHNLQLVLTDLYPSSENIERFNSENQPNISYAEKPVNAVHLNSAPEGLKTMVNCFHHMPPNKARSILSAAQETKQTLLIYELSDNAMPTLLWWLFLPVSFVIMFLMVWVMTPAVRPLTFRQILFTYFIPIIPVFYFWDGQASMPRTYTLSDYDELLPEANPDYSWEKGYALNDKKKKNGTYLLGMPKLK
ncbi:MAG: hypothetical protein JXR22_09430 [Prolixibacteraceae bacterium]|nr:hypothetical protein [Prolixibacteraceae bacterium]